MADLITKEVNTSKYLGDLETWIASPQGQRYSCTRQYPYPGYACDYHGATCVGCLIVAAACELRNKVPASETCEQRYLKALQQIIMLSHEFNKERNAYAVKLEEIAHEAVTNAPNLNAECSACGARYEAIKGHRCTANALKACEHCGERHAAGPCKDAVVP